MKTDPITTSFCLLALVIPVAADTFVMKDGSKLEGAVLRSDATSYVLEVQVTKSIKDERVVAKADVLRIDKEDPSLAAFAALGALSPAPDVLSAEDYAQRIRTLGKFLSDYPMSPKVKEAKAILATFKAEANEVLAGGIKLNGRIVPATERRTNAYDIDARVQEAKIRKLATDGQALQALRAFSGFGRDFANTTAYVGLAPLMSQLMTSYMAEASSLLASYDARVKERKLGLERMVATERRNTENAINEENAALETRFKAEKDAKLGWVTIHPFFKPALDETMTFGKLEVTRLATAQSVAFVDGGKAFRDAMTAIQSKGDATQITAAVAAAKTAMLPARYIAILEAAAPNTGAKR